MAESDGVTPSSATCDVTRDGSTAERSRRYRVDWSLGIRTYPIRVTGQKIQAFWVRGYLDTPLPSRNQVRDLEASRPRCWPWLPQVST